MFNLISLIFGFIYNITNTLLQLAHNDVFQEAQATYTTILNTNTTPHQAQTLYNTLQEQLHDILLVAESRVQILNSNITQNLNMQNEAPQITYDSDLESRRSDDSGLGSSPRPEDLELGGNGSDGTESVSSSGSSSGGSGSNLNVIIWQQEIDQMVAEWIADLALEQELKEVESTLWYWFMSLCMKRWW
ncbi:hypothetical protein L873DRAFT_1809563 [Choiromyces venosus 120613-1]|uniref:Uncharacterized protein n=1 Tax=Choiromyces venosus 120613-1 TaxID=1336337 RepID=A0A3N4JH27_9PEZI|nr:hypothetical protein L873DRAFT_1809563 [Choiromyces venosus 120613-1]